MTTPHPHPSFLNEYFMMSRRASLRTISLLLSVFALSGCQEKPQPTNETTKAETAKISSPDVSSTPAGEDVLATAKAPATAEEPIQDAAGAPLKKAELAPTPEPAEETLAPSPDPEDVSKVAPTQNLHRIQTPDGVVIVSPIQHASFYLTWGDIVIHVDPVEGGFKAMGEDAKKIPSADLILITDLHHDHLDPKQIERVRKPDAIVVTPKASAKGIKNPTVLANDASISVLDNAIKITAVPMYNIKRKRPDNGEFFHVKGRGNGYLITRDETTIYISGDTECTPEMKALKNIDVAFVCMNLPYTMPIEEAAECVQAFKPNVVFPFHHRGQDPTKFTTLLKDTPNTEVRILDWYPDG